jgi:hypothetical protein
MSPAHAAASQTSRSEQRRVSRGLLCLVSLPVRHAAASDTGRHSLTIFPRPFHLLADTDAATGAATTTAAASAKTERNPRWATARPVHAHLTKTACQAAAATIAHVLCGVGAEAVATRGPATVRFAGARPGRTTTAATVTTTPPSTGADESTFVFATLEGRTLGDAIWAAAIARAKKSQAMQRTQSAAVLSRDDAAGAPAFATPAEACCRPTTVALVTGFSTVRIATGEVPLVAAANLAGIGITSVAETLAAGSVVDALATPGSWREDLLAETHAAPVSGVRVADTAAD